MRALKPLKEYRLGFTGLKQGKHVFTFDLDRTFFDEFEYSLVKDGDLKVEVELDKQETMLLFSFVIVGSIRLNCDLCLSDFSKPVEIREHQIVKFSDDANLEDNTDELIVIGYSEHEFDIAPLIYEYINLAVPFAQRCDEPGGTKWCDKQMLEHLERLSVGAQDEEENNDVNPNWEALKKLKD